MEELDNDEACNAAQGGGGAHGVACVASLVRNQACADAVQDDRGAIRHAARVCSLRLEILKKRMTRMSASSCLVFFPGDFASKDHRVLVGAPVRCSCRAIRALSYGL